MVHVHALYRYFTCFTDTCRQPRASAPITVHTLRKRPLRQAAERTSTFQPNLASQKSISSSFSLTPALPPRRFSRVGWELFVYVAGVGDIAWKHAEVHPATFAGVVLGSNSDCSPGVTNDVANFRPAMPRFTYSHTTCLLYANSR